MLPQVVDAVAVPVIAAGGIADGRGVAAALMLGASAVQVGTAFLGCHEANLADTHRAALADVADTSTLVTDVISGRPARFIRNQIVETLSAPGAAPLPFPAQSILTAALDATGDGDVLTVLAGQSAALAREMPADDLVNTLAEETTLCLEGFVD